VDSSDRESTVESEFPCSFKQDSILEDVFGRDRRKVERPISENSFACSPRLGRTVSALKPPTNFTLVSHPLWAIGIAMWTSAGSPVSAWPFLDSLAPIYFFPCLEQYGLLYQPLSCMSWGHVFYRFIVRRWMTPKAFLKQRRRRTEAKVATQRSARRKRAKAGTRSHHVAYRGRREFPFPCDAVGIGGPSVPLEAFGKSRGLSRDDFTAPTNLLQDSTHP